MHYGLGSQFVHDTLAALDKCGISFTARTLNGTMPVLSLSSTSGTFALLTDFFFRPGLSLDAWTSGFMRKEMQGFDPICQRNSERIEARDSRARQTELPEN